ncbi:MAG: carbon starvation protein A [Halobacteria archaeon]
MTQAILLVVISIVLFSLGYLGYSRYLARMVNLGENDETPAHKYEDGEEYVPANKTVLLGHHFSSIAGGAPIVGPITAGVWWGWVPSIIWIGLGNPLIGAVHDFMSLSTSVRHDGKSIGYIIGQYLGDKGKKMFLWFALLTLILIIGVFALLVGLVFTAYPQTATASIIYILLALLFGVYLYQLNLPFIPGAVIFIAAVFAGVFAGDMFPIALTADAGSYAPYPDGTIVLMDSTALPKIMGSGNITGWTVGILIYGFFASVLPVWQLLQPRDFLTSNMLYVGVGGTLLAVLVGTVMGSGETLTIDLATYKGFMGDPNLPAGPLFPLLFVTIACGSVSGFHSLVSSGTTSKQLNQEEDARLIGYGGMLAEGLLATAALVTVAVYAKIPTGSGIGLALPNFATGGGIILNNAFGVSKSFAAPFMGLVLVSFLLTSTDTAIRIARYMSQELVGTPETRTQKIVSNKYVVSAAITVPSFLLVASGSWNSLWPLFGGANQMLAALALLIVTIWLANEYGSKQLVSTGLPTAFMYVITILALLYLAFYQNLYQKLLSSDWMSKASGLDVASSAIQIVIGVILILLALAILKLGLDNLRSIDTTEDTGNE